LLKQLTSHQNPEGSYEKLFEKVVDFALEKLDPERRQARRQKQKTGQSLPTSEVKIHTRYISRVLRDEIWQRDKGQCQYLDPKTGRVCNSRHSLEIDHKYPFALGGENSEKNLRLICRQHNQFRAKELLERFKEEFQISVDVFD
jgi:5-methylcytosine-specific restriction endonuclease McrA